MEALTNNIKAEIVDRDGSRILVIEARLDPDPKKSESGKSHLLASTRGNKTLSSGETIGLNIYKKIEK